MQACTVILLFSAWPFVEFYIGVPNDRIPVLPPPALPRLIGGDLLPPVPPSHSYILARQERAGRRPGDRIISYQLIDEQIEQARFYPGIGRALYWRLTYACRINGPDGPDSIYLDRSALIRLE